MSFRLLYNRETKQLEQVPEAEITQRVSSGKYTFQQKGIDIPVVAPDGVQTTISSDEAEKGFREMGYRWLTQEEGKQRASAEIEQQRKEIFGNMPIVAGAAGVARSATFGISDFIAKSAGLGKEMDEVRKQNPTASLIGEVAGAFTPIPGAVGKAAVSLAGKAMKGVPEATSLIGKIGRSAAEMGLGSAVEGAAQGFGQGITEASLGDPNKVVENMFFNTGLGAGAGGVIGGLFGGVGKAGSIAVKASTEKLGAILPDLAKDVAEKTIVPGLRAFGRGDAADQFKALLRDRDLVKIVDPQTRQMIQEVEETALLEFAGMKSQGKKLSQEVSTELKTIRDDKISISQETQKAYNTALRQAKIDIKDVPAETEKLVQGALEQNAGDVLSAMRSVEQLVQKEQGEFREAVLKNTGAANGIGVTALQTLERTIENMVNKGGTAKHKAVADELLSDVFTQFGSDLTDVDGFPARLAVLQKQMTEGEEALFVRTIRQKIDAKIPYKNPNKIMDPEVRQAYLPVYKLRDNINALLKQHPNEGIALGFQTFDKRYQKFKSAETMFDKLARVRTDVWAEGDAVVRKSEDRVSKAVKSLMNPELAPKLDKAMAQLNDLFPHLQVATHPSATSQMKLNELQTIRDKVSSLLGNEAKKSDVHAVVDTLLSLIPGKQGAADELIARAGKAASAKGALKGVRTVLKDDTLTIEAKLAKIRGESETTTKLAQLRKLQEELAVPGQSTLDKYLRMKETLSGTKDDALSELTKLDDKIRSLNGLSFLGGGPSAGTGVLPGVTAGGVATAIAGPVIGVPVGLFVHGVQNPVSALRGVAMVERYANKGATLVNELSQQVIKSVTSPVVARASNYVTTRMAKTLFNQQAEALADFQDPNRAVAKVGEMTAGLSDSPQIQQAMNGHVMKTGQFLYAKLPKSPQALSLTQKQYEVDPGEMLEFQRYVNAVTNPASVLENVANGTVTPQEIETLKELYPQTHKAVVDEIVKHAATLKENLPYERRIMLANLIGAPIDDTLTPEFISFMQNSIVPGQRAQEQAAMGKEQGLSQKVSAPNLAKAEGTQISRISDR